MILSKNTYSNTLYNKKIINDIKKLEQISNAHIQSLIQLQKQLSGIEQEIDLLRSQIQENEHQLFKIHNEQKNIIKKMNILIKKNPKTLQNNNISTTSKNDKKDILTLHNHTQQHIIDYNKAVNLVLEKKQYEKAIQSFKKFISNHPNSIYQANAHYWLGQLNYRKGNKSDASYHFALVAKNYPQSQKASDALLKVGIIMEERGYKDQAKFIYKQIESLYPNTDASKQSKKRLIN